MKKLLAAIAIAMLSSQVAMADQYVNGHVRSDGTYVAPHYRSSPDNNRYNNYSSQGNTNPYTGRQGTQEPSRYTNTIEAPKIEMPRIDQPYGQGRRY